MRYAIVLVLAILLATASAAADDDFERLPSPAWVEDTRDPLIYVWPELRFLAVQGEEARAGDDLQVDDRGIVRILEDEVEAAGGVLDLDAMGLLVRGPKEARDLARRRVLSLGDWLAGRSEVSVTVARVGEPPDTADALRAALRKGGAEVVLHTKLETRRGGTSVSEETSSRTLVAAMDVEVAQEASIADPMSARLTTGCRVSVHCRPVTGEWAVATLSLHVSGEPEVEEVRTSAGTLHLPEVPFLSFFGALKLVKGVDRLLVFRHPWEEGYLAVLVRLQSLPAPPETPRLVDMAALAGWPDAKDAWEPTGGFNSNWDPDVGLPVRPERGAGYRISQRIEESLQEAPGFRTLSLNLVAVGGESSRPVVALQRAVEASSVVLEKSVLELPWEQFVEADWFDPETGDVDLEKSALAGWRRDLRVPCLSTTPLLLVRGVYRRFIAREAVEIAQSAAILKPVVGTHVEGESLLAEHEEGGEGLSVTQSTSALVGRERRELSVAKDILGRRAVERDHLVDLLETRETYRRVSIGQKPVVTVRRVGDRAIVEVWSR